MGEGKPSVNSTPEPCLLNDPTLHDGETRDEWRTVAHLCADSTDLIRFFLKFTLLYFFCVSKDPQDMIRLQDTSAYK